MVSNLSIRVLKNLVICRKYIVRSILFITGYILSPLTWWNDLFVNIPLAYVMASITSYIVGRHLFLELFIGSYLFTNVLGLLLMHVSVTGFSSIRCRKIFYDVLAGILYTLLIYILVYLGFIKPL